MESNLVQWVDLAVYGMTLLLFATGMALAFWRLHREKKGAQAQELARIDQARGALESLLGGSVFGLVTAAEKTYGAGTGPIKKSAVLAELLKLIPNEWGTLLDADTLGGLIEKGLGAAKEIWAKAKI